MPEMNQPLKSFHIVFIAAEFEYNSEHSLAGIAKMAEQQGARTYLTCPAQYKGVKNFADRPEAPELTFSSFSPAIALET